MKHLKKELQKAMIERFKLYNCIKGIEKLFSEQAKEMTFEKYNGTKIKKDNLVYELYGVASALQSSEDYATLPEIDLSLFFIITAELDKDEQEELKRAKNILDNNNYITYHDSQKFKRKLWVEMYYNIDIDNVIENRKSKTFLLT